MVIETMLSQEFDHGFDSKFLFYYQRSRLTSSTAEEKQKIIDMVVLVQYFLDQDAVPFKNLLGILRISRGLNLNKCTRNKLECMVGSMLDQATPDDLLVPSPIRKTCLYDVSLVLRLLKSFLGRGACCVPLTRLIKVASLMNLYLAKVAPDPCLKPSKFLGLVRALPESARTSYDGVYHALDLYLEVHAGLSKREILQICCAINYEKLSSEACNHLAHNSKFPSESVAQALICQRCKLKNLLSQPSSFMESPSCSFVENQTTKGKNDKQIVLYAGKLELSPLQNEKLRMRLQCRALEWEKICRKMQCQVTKIVKSRLSSHSHCKSLPKLCS